MKTALDTTALFSLSAKLDGGGGLLTPAGQSSSCVSIPRVRNPESSLDPLSEIVSTCGASPPGANVGRMWPENKEIVVPSSSCIVGATTS